MCSIQFEEQYKVSVIMPVYNSEKYLKECLNSVLDQTLKQMQIICVDDGSADRSLDILNNYSRDNKNILILHTEHKGASHARNMGLKYAEGAYVIVLDSDDLYDKSMLDEMYACAIEYDADVVVCESDQDLVTEDNFLGNVLEKYMEQYRESPFTMRNLPMEGWQWWESGPCNKLCRKKFLVENEIEFQELKSANDVYYASMVMLLAKRIIHTNSFKPFYHYRRVANDGQISNSRSLDDIYKAYEKTFAAMTKLGIVDEYYEQYYVAVFNRIVMHLASMRGDVESNQRFYTFFAESGMRRIGLEQVSKKGKLGLYRKYINYFKDYTFASEWYRKMHPIGLQLEQKGMSDIEDMCKKNKVALWGMGAKGNAIVEVLRRNQIFLKGLIDNDKRKQGSLVYGYVVSSYQQLMNHIEIVIVTNKDNFASICGDIYRSGKIKQRVLPLFAYLESNMTLEECIFTVDEIK